MALEEKREYVDGYYDGISRCYELKEEYEKFGWKFVGREDYVDADGPYYYLNFTRDKDAPWYNRVCELKKEYDAICRNDYEGIKNKYNYEERAKIGKKPIEPPKHKLAEPSKFFKGMIVFIIGILIMLIGISQPPETQESILYIGVAISILGLIVLLSKIKYLQGLKGEEKRKELERQLKYKKNKEKYESEVKKFFESRKNEIEEEIRKICN
ncbi:MAG: hypothetical protein IKZ38_04185 [Clostridia bacterium]|nr:hypothetical protein [Clostridia bacterium]